GLHAVRPGLALGTLRRRLLEPVQHLGDLLLAEQVAHADDLTVVAGHGDPHGVADHLEVDVFAPLTAHGAFAVGEHAHRTVHGVGQDVTDGHDAGVGLGGTCGLGLRVGPPGLLRSSL